MNQIVDRYGKRWLIEKVGVHWYNGWYLLYCLGQQEGSHGMSYIAKWKTIYRSNEQIAEIARGYTEFTPLEHPF